MAALQTTQLNIPEGMIDLGVGQPSLSLLPIDDFRHAAEHRLGQGSPEMLQYGAEQGDGFFRNALSQFLTRQYQAPVNADQLMITCGASQALDLVCTRFTKPGDTIFVEAPTYFLALVIFRDYGLNVIGIPIDSDGVRLEALEEALTRHRPVFFYTIPTFQNPSATTLPLERREQLVKLSQQHDFLIVADEVYHLLSFGNTPPAPLATWCESERVIALGSFSKISAPGVRLGWIQSARKHLKTLLSAGLLESGGGLNPFTSSIMQSMLELGLQDACLERLRTVYHERATVMCEALHTHLPSISFAEPLGGFFIWLQLPGDRSAAEFLPKARAHGVSFQSGARFGSDNTLTPYLRLSFAYYDTPELVEGVKRLAHAIG